MGTRNRILSIHLMGRIKKNPEYAKQIGVDARLVERDQSKRNKNEIFQKVLARSLQPPVSM